VGTGANYIASGAKSQAVQLKSQAVSNIADARGIIVKEKGMGAIIDLKFWGLLFAQITLSNIIPIFFAILITGIFLMAYLFGTISACYALYFLKIIPSTFLNVFLTIGNALWFALHMIATALMYAFVTIINTIQYWFLKPLIDAINAIAHVFGAGDPLKFQAIFEGKAIPVQPHDAFAYLMPDAVKWGDWGSLISYKWIRCGANPYLNGEYVRVMGQNGATLLFPKYDPKGIADGIWAPVAGRPDDIIYNFFNWYHPETWWKQAQRFLFDFGRAVANFITTAMAKGTVSIFTWIIDRIPFLRGLLGG